MAAADLVGEEKRAAHKDGDDEARDEAEGENDFLHVRLLVRVRMDSRCGVTGPDVVILSDDFSRNGAEIMLSGDEVTAGGLVLFRAGRPGCGGRLRACRRCEHNVS